jgi:hypothetical protein
MTSSYFPQTQKLPIQLFPECNLESKLFKEKVIFLKVVQRYPHRKKGLPLKLGVSEAPCIP